MGFCNSGACITLAHTPLKAILLQGTICSTFPQLWRVACHFKQILHYFEKQQGESKFACFKYVSDTWWLGGQCSCHNVLMTSLYCLCGCDSLRAAAVRYRHCCTERSDESQTHSYRCPGPPSALLVLWAPAAYASSTSFSPALPSINRTHAWFSFSRSPQEKI